MLNELQKSSKIVCLLTVLIFGCFFAGFFFYENLQNINLINFQIFTSQNNPTDTLFIQSPTYSPFNIPTFSPTNDPDENPIEKEYITNFYSSKNIFRKKLLKSKLNFFVWVKIC